jgi:hypothetical protein
MADAAPSSRVCRQIEAQLSGGGAGPGKWSSAVTRQRAEIAKARQQMRAAGCGFFSNDRTCRSLSNGVSRMERNLSNLQRGQAHSEGGGRSRAQLLAALEANNCRGERRLVAAERQPGLLERLFGADRRTDAGDQIVRDNIVSGETSNTRRRRDNGSSSVIAPGFDSSLYRTFCVRTCDGYYFPMSPASSRNDFARDGQNCQAACPGTDVQVYYHQADQEDAADMRSAVSSRPYSDMATAFLYRSNAAPRDITCTCSAKQDFAVVAGEHKQVETQVVGIEATGTAAPAMPLPRSRPDPGTDPETLLNREGNFGPDQIRTLLSGNGDSTEAGRRVRSSGQCSFPTQQGQ